MCNNFMPENLHMWVIALRKPFVYTLSTPLPSVYQRNVYFINTLLIMCKVNNFPVDSGDFRV